MADDELSAKITLDEQQFSVAVNKVIAQLGSLDGAVQGLGTRLENALDKSLGKVGKQLEGLSLDNVAGKLDQAANKLQAAFSATVGPAIEFEAAMRNVNTVAKLSEPDLAALSEQMRTLGKEIGVGIAPTEAAAAQYDILSAGFTNAADATEVLKQAAIASKGGLTSTSSAADLLTSALNAYGAGADQAKRFSDVLFTGVEKGKLTFDDFVAGLGSVVPAAAANNVSIEELSAAMAALTAAGQQPARAFTGLNAAIVQLSSPTKEARKAAAGLGVDLDGAGFKGLSLVQKLQALAIAAGDNKSALRQVLGDVNALGVAYSLAGNGAGIYQDALTTMQGPLDASANAARENSKSFKSSQEEFAAAAQGLGIALSQTLLPAMTGIAKGGKTVIEFFDSFSPGAKAAAGATLGVVTALTAAGAAIGSFLLGARGAAALLGVQLPASAATASGALTALSTRVAAARSAVLGFNLACLAGPAALVAIGAGLIVAAQQWVDVEQAALKAADAIETVGGQALKGTTADVSTGTLLSTPVQDLKKQGVTKEDAQNRIRELRETLEDTVDTAARQKLQEKIDQLIAVREQLATAGEVQAKQAKVDPAVQDFLAGRKAPPEDPEAIKERRKQALFEIETAKLSGQERIKALEAFLAKEKLAGDERRSVEQKIFQEREKLEKAAADAAKAATADRIADSLQEIDNSKASHQTKIQQLGELAKKYQDNADLQRRIRDLIAREEEQKDKEAEERRKKKEQEAKKAAEAAKDRAQEEVNAKEEAVGLQRSSIDADLGKAKEKGDFSGAQRLLAERQRLTEETIRLQLQEQLAQTQSAEARVQLEANAEERIRQERVKTAEELKKLQDEQVKKAKETQEKLKPATSTQFRGDAISVEQLAQQLGGSGATSDKSFEERQAATEAARIAKMQKALAGGGTQDQMKQARARLLALNSGRVAAGGQAFSDSDISALLAKNFGSKLAKTGATSAPTINAKLEPLEVNVNITKPDGSKETQRTTLTGVGAPGSGPSSVSTAPRGRA